MADQQRIEREMVERLLAALGEDLESVVLYGPEVHDDAYRGVGTAHLMIVVADLEPATLRRLGEPVRWWLGRGQSWPRLFTAQTIRDCADVFPIELLDIVRYHRILHGPDPVTAITVDRAHLRLQCERELREKTMRLCEGYVERHGRPAALLELLTVSYPAFVRVFRGCLQLHGAAVPRHDPEVVAGLCERLDLSRGAFERVERIARGELGDADAEAAFTEYYRALSQVAQRIDRFVAAEGRTS